MMAEIRAKRSRGDRSTFALASLQDASRVLLRVAGGGAALTTG
jgi:hypothetical protein